MKIHRDQERPDLNSYSRGVIDLEYPSPPSFLLSTESPTHNIGTNHRTKADTKSERHRTDSVKNVGFCNNKNSSL